MNNNSTQGFQRDWKSQNLEGAGETGLERLCVTGRDMIRTSPSEEGIDRIEARFSGNGFAPHRHDTYAIGLTLAGVQTFRYRGEERASLPGQIIVIHPDELHDGGAGTERGLRYRMIYIPPEMIADALQTAGHFAVLPFVASPVFSDPDFQRDLIEALDDIDTEMGAFKRDSLLADLAGGLCRRADNGKSDATAVNRPALRQCSEYLRECCGKPVQMKHLEGIAHMDRFTLSRQFRTAFGTSPHRYLIMRRLDRVKSALALGGSLAEAAAESGFADQSHMTRHFKRAYGMTPSHWRRLCT